MRPPRRARPWAHAPPHPPDSPVPLTPSILERPGTAVSVGVSRPSGSSLGPWWGQGGTPTPDSPHFLQSLGPSIYIKPRAVSFEVPPHPARVSFRFVLTALRLPGPRPTLCSFYKHTHTNPFHLVLSNFAPLSVKHSPKPIPTTITQMFTHLGDGIPALLSTHPGSGGTWSKVRMTTGSTQRGLRASSLAELPREGSSS